MGKTRNRKYRKKNNPTGLATVKSVDLEDDERGLSSGSNTLTKNDHIIQTILEQLEMPGVDGKLCGLTTLSSLTDDPEFVEDVVNHNIIRIAGPLLVDTSSILRNAAAIALRNLSGMGIPEICDLLIEEDVLTCVFTLFNKYYSTNWLLISENGESMAVDNPGHKKSKKERSRKDSKNHSETGALLGEDLLTNTFTQAVHILWNLCKSSDLAVKIFNQQNILPILSRCLDPKECGIEPAVAVAHCLHTVTEDNEVAAHELRHSSEDVLLKILSPAFEGERSHSGKPSKFLLLRVLAAGIVMNITKGSADLTPILNVRLGLAISDAIAEDHRSSFSNVSKIIQKEKKPRPTSPNNSESMDEDEVSLEFCIAETEALIMAQTIAVELLTNLYFKEEEDDDWVDSDCEDLPESESVNNQVTTADGLPEMQEAFGEQGYIENLVKKIEKDEEVWKEIQSNPDTKNLISRVNTLRCRSLLCLHNVITSLQDEDLGGFTGVLSLWERLGKLVFKEGSEDTDLLEAASAAMRAVAERLKKIDPRSFACNVTMPGLEMLFDAEKKCTDPSTRANLIRTVGIMGESLCHSIRDEIDSLLGCIGIFLLKVSSQGDEELWVVAEALDALMDVFSEDSTDKAASEIGLVDSLRPLLPGLRSKLRQQRKQLGHHAAIIATANSNLERFVEYKAKHIINGSITNNKNCK